MSKNMAIQIEGLYYSYDVSRNARRNVLEDINLCIEDNEFTAIIGENGGGKTTLLKNITGLLRPSAGNIRIRGKDTREMSVPAISAEIGFVMQNPDRQLFAGTAYAEIAFALKNAGLPESEISRRVEDALAAVEISGARDSYPPALARGERTKIVLASVLAMRPGIIILDEPTGGLDYRGSTQIMEIASALHRQGHTIIFVTHNMSLVCAYARRIIVVSDRRIAADGKPEDVFARARENGNILPPQINRLSRELRADLPLEKEALTVQALGDILIEFEDAANRE